MKQAEVTVARLRQFCRSLKRRAEAGVETPAEIGRAARERLPPTLAVKVFRRLNSLQPQGSESMVGLVECYLQLGQIAKAEKALARRIAKGATGNEVLNLHARLANQLQRWELARERWQVTLHHHPGDPAALRGLAGALARLGEAEPAIALYRRLIDEAKANPADHYTLAELIAQRDRRWLTPADTGALAERFPDDADLAARHVGRLRAFHEAAAAEDFLRAWAERTSAPLDLGPDRRPGPEDPRGAGAKAAALHLERFEADPQNFAHLAAAARSLAKAGRWQEAQKLVSQVEAGEHAEQLFHLRADLCLLAGREAEAARWLLRALRLCGSLSNAARLGRFLIDRGRFGYADLLLSRFAEAFAQSASGRCELALLQARMKRVEPALALLEPALRSLGMPQHFMSHYASLLWQTGKLRRTRTVTLALATRRTELLLEEGGEGGVLKEVRKEVRVSARQLAALGERQHFTRHAQRLRALVPSAAVLRAGTRPDREAGSLLRALTLAERRGDAEATYRQLRGGLAELVDRTGNPGRAGDLLYRAARLAEAAGRPGAALAWLEQAVWANKQDPLLLRAYRAALARHAGRLAGGRGLACVLVVSWQGNLERARYLAEGIREESGFVAFTLSGDPAAALPKAVAKPYGYDLVVPSGDGYTRLARKVMLAYRFLAACTGFAAVFKIDDDCWIADFDRFRQALEACVAAGDDYAGRMTEYRNGIYHHSRHRPGAEVAIAEHDPVPFCFGGLGYFLSRRSLEAIFTLGLTHFRTEGGNRIYEDVLVGEILAAAGIQPVDRDFPRTGGLLAELNEPLLLLAER